MKKAVTTQAAQTLVLEVSHEDFSSRDPDTGDMFAPHLDIDLPAGAIVLHCAIDSREKARDEAGNVVMVYAGAYISEVTSSGELVGDSLYALGWWLTGGTGDSSAFSTLHHHLRVRPLISQAPEGTAVAEGKFLVIVTYIIQGKADQILQ